MTQNLAVELLNKHKDRLEKDRRECLLRRESCLTELLKVEAILRDTEHSIDTCTKEINRVTVLFTSGIVTGYLSTCQKQ